jgi:hypothetical protein
LTIAASASAKSLETPELPAGLSAGGGPGFCAALWANAAAAVNSRTEKAELRKKNLTLFSLSGAAAWQLLHFRRMVCVEGITLCNARLIN